MKQNTSAPTKIAGTFLIAVGFITFGNALRNLAVQAEIARELTEKLLDLGILAWGILGFIAGWNLTKKKRWAYILALISVLLLIGLQAFIQVEPIRYISIGIAVFVLILLIAGRKDFKKV